MSERSEAKAQYAVLDAAPAYRMVPAEAIPDDVPSGYKRTEVGVIPEDWAVRNIGDLGQIRRGASPRPIAHPKWFDAKSDIGWLRISDVAREGKYIRTTDQNLSVSGVSRSRLVEPGNVIMSMAATVGRPAINQKPVCIHDGFVVFEKPRLSPEFFYYLLLAIEDKWVERGQTGSQINLNTNLIGSTPVPLPESSDEQRAIATALSDADALIQSLDRLIAKKRDIKQATMQQLLTGQTRLPGFKAAWKTKRLGDLADMQSGGTPATDRGEYFGGGIPWVSITDMTRVNKYISFSLTTLTERGLRESTAVLFPRNAVLLAMYASIGECCIATVPLATSQAILGIRTKSGLHEEFLYYWLAWIKEELAAQGQQGTQANLNKQLVRDILVSAPSLEEQEAISTVLSDMDREIETLERRRDKARQIKQGMMQQLLTGRVRLIAPEKVA